MFSDLKGLWKFLCVQYLNMWCWCCPKYNIQYLFHVAFHHCPAPHPSAFENVDISWRLHLREFSILCYRVSSEFSVILYWEKWDWEYYPLWLSSKESACQCGRMGLIPGSGGSPGGGNCNLLQYSCLENPMDEEPGGLQSIVSARVEHDWAWMHAHTHTHIMTAFPQDFHCYFTEKSGTTVLSYI